MTYIVVCDVILVTMTRDGKNPYRKSFIKSTAIVSTLGTVFILMLSHLLFEVPYTLMKDCVESRMKTIEKKTNELLNPYRDQTGRHLDERSLSYQSEISYNNNTNYSHIYVNGSRDHTTQLITKTRCPHSFHLLILITSNLKNFERRHTIRMTWGEDPVSRNRKWKTYFLVGRTDDNFHLYQLSLEIQRYGDIVLADTIEDFYNLAPKLHMGFEWANKYCDYKFLMKGDDDVFVNVPRLLDFLDDAGTPKESLYAGNCHYAANVFRDGRYGISKEEYWKDIYPRYCSGGGYILTKDVVEKFLSVIYVVKVFKIDDAYIGELALKTGVDVFHSKDFQMFQSNERCLFRKETIVHHPVKSRPCMKLLYGRTVESIIGMFKNENNTNQIV